MDELQKWAGKWGDLGGLLDLALGIIGFAITIFAVWRAKTAAEQARTASNAVKDALAHHAAIADLSTATNVMDEIKRHHRSQSWAVLPDRYSELRRCLVAIVSSHTQLTEGDRQTMQGVIEVFRALERRIERAIQEKGAPPDPAKLNDIVSTQIDEVRAILLTVQRTLEVPR